MLREILGSRRFVTGIVIFLAGMSLFLIRHAPPGQVARPAPETRHVLPAANQSAEDKLTGIEEEIARKIDSVIGLIDGIVD